MDWSSVTLTYFLRSSWTLDFQMIIHEPFKNKVGLRYAMLSSSVNGIGHWRPWPTSWSQMRQSCIYLKLKYNSENQYAPMSPIDLNSLHKSEWWVISYGPLIMGTSHRWSTFMVVVVVGGGRVSNMCLISQGNNSSVIFVKMT